MTVGKGATTDEQNEHQHSHKERANGSRLQSLGANLHCARQEQRYKEVHGEEEEAMTSPTHLGGKGRNRTPEQNFSLSNRSWADERRRVFHVFRPEVWRLDRPRAATNDRGLAVDLSVRA